MSMTNSTIPTHAARSVTAKRQRPAGSTRFVELARTEPEPVDLGVMAAVDIVELEDSWGDPVEVTPGVINDETRWIYLNGQCLALAVAIATENDWPVVVHTSEYDPEGINDDGDPEQPTIKHAYALGPDGTLYDIDGENDREALELSGNETLTEYKPIEARFYFEGDLSEQDYVTAASFIAHVFEADQ